MAEQARAVPARPRPRRVPSTADTDLREQLSGEAPIRHQPPLLRLQSSIGNRGVSALLGGLAVQRDAPAANFDPKAVRNELIRAINTTPVMVGTQMRLYNDAGQVDPNVRPHFLPRKVETGKVVAALENRTAREIEQVVQSYWDHEGRTLDHDLFSTDQGGTDLSPVERVRLAALLKGTAADPAGAQAPMAAGRALAAWGLSDNAVGAVTAAVGVLADAGADKARSARREADAAEFRQLITDDPNESERERIMALLRTDKPDNDLLAGHYHRLFNAEITADLGANLSGLDLTRATRLLAGNRVGADAAAVELRLQKIDALQKVVDSQTAALQKGQDPLGAAALLGGGTTNAVTIARYLRDKAEKDRRTQVEALQAVLERARREATAGADAATVGTAANDRMAAILHTRTAGGLTVDEAVSKSLSAAERSTVSAMAAGSAPELAAARIRQAAAAGTFSVTMMETEVRGLRSQAADDARSEVLSTLAELATELPPEDRVVASERLQAGLPEAIAKRTTSYFATLKSSYDAGDPQHGALGSAFDRLTKTVESGGDTGKLAALIKGEGQLPPLDEVVFALEGSKSDIETVKRVLGGMSRADIDKLVADYQQRTGRPLREVLFGKPPPERAESIASLASLAGVVAAPISVSAMLGVKGKASGYDAFVLQELLGVPAYSKDGKDAAGDADKEAEFLARQSRAEANWAVSDAGAMGKVHDFFDDEAKSLMTESADTAMSDLRIYRSYMAAGKVEEANRTLAELRQDRTRTRLDRAAYSDTIERFRASVATALSFAIDAAVLVFLPAAAPFLLGAAVTAAGHIAANLIAYGDKYDSSMLTRDLLSAIGSAGATKLAKLALAGRAAGAAVQVGEEAAAGARLVGELTEELSVTASRTISREASGLASPSLLALAKREAGTLLKEGAENFAGDLGGQWASTGDINPSAAGVAKSVLMGRGARAARGALGIGPKAPGPGPTHAEPDSADNPHTRPTKPYPTAEPPVDDPHTRPTKPYPTAEPPVDDPHTRPTKPYPTAEPPVDDPHTRPTKPYPTAEPPVDDPHTRPTKPYPAAEPPVDDAHTRPTKPYQVAEPDAADEARTRRATPDDDTTKPRIIPAPPGRRARQPAPVETGKALQSADPTNELQAWRIYGRLRAADPYREVGMMFSKRLKIWAVVQGGPNETVFDVAARELGWPAADVRIGRHSHPIRAGAGHTPLKNTLPSGRGGDLSGVEKDSARGGPEEAKVWEAIDVMIRPDPKQPAVPDRTWVVYERATGTFTVDYPKPGAPGGRGRLVFHHKETYHRWFKHQFGSEPGKSLPPGGGAGVRRASTPEDINEVREHATDPRSHGVDEAAAGRVDEHVDLDLYERHLMAELDYAPPDWSAPQRLRVPAASRGGWDPPGGRGEGFFTPHDPGAYGLERGQSIEFRRGVPDLGPYAVRTPGGHPGTVDVPDLTLSNRRMDRILTVEAIARRENWQIEQVYAWLSQERLRLHHYQGSVMQIVPERLHVALAHQGSVATGR